MFIGDKIKKLRDDKGWKQVELAEKLSIANNTLSQYESNARQPDPDTIKKIAKLFDVTTDYLLGLNEERYSDKDFAKLEEIYFGLSTDKRKDLYIYAKNLSIEN